MSFSGSSVLPTLECRAERGVLTARIHSRYVLRTRDLASGQVVAVTGVSRGKVRMQCGLTGSRPLRKICRIDDHGWLMCCLDS